MFRKAPEAVIFLESSLSGRSTFNAQHLDAQSLVTYTLTLELESKIEDLVEYHCLTMHSLGSAEWLHLLSTGLIDARSLRIGIYPLICLIN